MANAEHFRVASAANGIIFPVDNKQWLPVGVSHRADTKSLRLVLANPIAKAIDVGKTDPWHYGSMLGKLFGTIVIIKDWASATVPGALVH